MGKGKPLIVVMGFGQNMKHQKDEFGSDYVMAYCVLQLIKPVDPKLTTNEHLAVLSTGIPTNELHPQNCKSLKLLNIK